VIVFWVIQLPRTVHVSCTSFPARASMQCITVTRIWDIAWLRERWETAMQCAPGFFDDKASLDDLQESRGRARPRSATLPRAC
jgi:hypothetical protein